MLHGEALTRSEAAQKAIGNLQDPRDSASSPGEKLRLLTQEGLPPVWGRRLLIAAAMDLSKKGRHDLAAAWLRRAQALVRDACGEDAPGYAALSQLADSLEEMARMARMMGGLSGKMKR